MKKPVILHIINSLGLGGAEVLLRDTVRSLHDYDHVICYLYAPDTLVEEFIPHPVYKLNHHSWSFSRHSINKLKGIMKVHGVDIVHAHLFEATLFARLATSEDIRFYFTIHNMLSKDAFEVNRLSKIAETLTYRKRQYIIGVSQVALDDYDRCIGIKGPSFVLYNYVHARYFELDYPYERPVEGALRLVAVGNLRRQKNYEGILEAFRLLRDEPFQLDIYGGGDLQGELQSFIDREKLNVRLMGRAEDVARVLPQYHGYLMGSLFEGFGIAPMEAMAAGMPVLLSDLEVFRELAEDVPHYFDPADPRSIADAIRFAGAHWEEMKERAKKGKSLICRKASQEVYFKKLLEIYRWSEQN